jgi:methionine synthase II (cobalamin-independent)
MNPMIKGALSTAIGSLPHKSVERAVELIVQLNIPVWPQLPNRDQKENMYVQYSEALPCLRSEDGKLWFETDRIEEELTHFYEKYLEQEIEHFGITPDYAEGFWRFLDVVPKRDHIKGQITGPVSFGLTVCDQNKRSLLYHTELFSAIRKGLSMKGVWQTERLKDKGRPIIFIDEPYLSAFGSSVIPISSDDVIGWLNDVIIPIKRRGAVVGIHCCGNTDWSILFSTEADIISFDAYNFAENFILYRRELSEFLKRGVVAFGIVPSGEEARAESAEGLAERLKELIGKERDLLVTPSCGLGSLSIDLAEKILEMTASICKLL